MDDVHGHAPPVWFVAFIRTKRDCIWDWLSPNQNFRHVMAFGFLPGLGLWQVFDPTTRELSTALVARDDMPAEIDKIKAKASEIWTVPQRGEGGPWAPAGCVSFVLHLTGHGWGALRPIGLRRMFRQRGYVREWRAADERWRKAWESVAKTKAAAVPARDAS